MILNKSMTHHTNNERINVSSRHEHCPSKRTSYYYCRTCTAHHILAQIATAVIKITRHGLDGSSSYLSANWGLMLMRDFRFQV